jgi:hypothetical protein
MNKERRNEIVNAWIAMTIAPQGGEVYEANFWSFDEIFDLCKDKPLEAWKVILDLVEVATTEDILAAVGAGPLEDLMCKYGETLISLVEQEATTNEKFLTAMRGVWLDSKDTPIWKKFYEIADIEPPFPEEN